MAPTNKLLCLWFLVASVFSQSIDDGEVCGYNNVTYATDIAAHAAGEGVLHCGACGACSNLHDIYVLNITRETLTDDTTICAALGITGNSDLVAGCLANAANFTDDCANCWLENFECTKNECFTTCLKEILSGDFGSKNLTDSKCLTCDEEKCGPAFIACAGANRRRAGIVSDIDRASDEICTIVDSSAVFDPQTPPPEISPESYQSYSYDYSYEYSYALSHMLMEEFSNYGL